VHLVRDALPQARDRPLVVGVGNAWRGDDAAGLLAADAAGGVRHEGDGTGLLERWAGAEHVVIVDAASAGAEPGRVTRFDARAAALPVTALRSSTHHFGVADAIELARSLGRLPPRLEVYAIEGAAFAAGAEVTPAVARAARELGARIRDNSG
jgi:hydrogenase maturation protease